MATSQQHTIWQEYRISPTTLTALVPWLAQAVLTNLTGGGRFE
jgi:hypothetical protein